MRAGGECGASAQEVGEKMAERMKDVYSETALRALATDLASVCATFQAEAFLQSILDDGWDSLELKGRILHISASLGRFLPAEYPEAIAVIDRVVTHYGSWQEGFVGFFPAFVEMFGQEEAHWDISIAALARYTPYASSEFAVRAFIVKHEERMMAQMYEWARDENELVRRLASEGCRPALPWGRALKSFKKDPAPVLPILERLKADPSATVRKSVANNLNDISKTHPALVVQLAQDWYGQNAYTDWVVKHGCRTLLKQGNRALLALFGFDERSAVAVQAFAVKTAAVPIGGDMLFSFDLSAEKAARVRLEYGIDYVKSNGKRNRKIFKISELLLRENEKRAYRKKHSFADVSVRRHYPGTHSITLIVNGAAQGTLDFEVYT